MINADKISQIQAKIEEIITDQVKNGQQNQALPNDYKACGQFFLKERTQRGLHGTASALKVLGLSTNNNVKDVIPSVIKYLTDHSKIEADLIAQSDPQEVLKRNENNVIKISECLFSLCYVQVGAGSKEALADTLVEKLKQGKLEDKGWGYFLNAGQSKVALLPTTFAALAIFSNGFSGFESTFDYLYSEIENKIKSKDIDLTTYAILVFALYVIVFYYQPQINNKETTKKLRALYKKLWKNDYRIYNEDIEQNIEYWHDENHYYVRIPWQLYMLALSSRFSSWNFSSVDSQKRLNSIYDNCTNKNGFRYDYSGPYFSVRTHSIIYEILSKIRENLKNNAWYILLNKLDYIRSFFSNRVFKIIASILSVALAGYIIFKWCTNKDFNIRELGPELLGPVLVWLILLGKKK